MAGEVQIVPNSSRMIHIVPDLIGMPPIVPDLMRMTQIVEEILPGHPAGVLTGPNLAKEIHFIQFAAGAIAGPMDSFLALRGMKTLDVSPELKI